MEELAFMFRLRKALEDKGITKSELSRISGVGKSDITYYLKGRYVPKQDKCYMLAKALDVDPGWLMTGIEPVADEELVPIVIPDSEKFRKVMEYMQRFPEDYHMVMDAYQRTYNKMREEGIDI
jgi:transcriptional regulator with XRE-family HTH domain